MNATYPEDSSARSACPAQTAHDQRMGCDIVESETCGVIGEKLLEAVVREEAHAGLERVSGHERAYTRVEAEEAVSGVGLLGDGPQPGRLQMGRTGSVKVPYRDAGLASAPLRSCGAQTASAS